MTFGGAGHYIREIKKRHTFDDILIYDLDQKRWFDPMKERDTHPEMIKHRIHQTNGQHYDDNNLSTSFANTPMKRLGHAAAIIGNCLVIHI